MNQDIHLYRTRDGQYMARVTWGSLEEEQRVYIGPTVLFLLMDRLRNLITWKDLTDEP